MEQVLTFLIYRLSSPDMKKCFKCKLVQPLSSYYVHRAMGDGHLGKCKTCTKKDTEERRALKESTDAKWVVAERKRHRIKSRKAREEGTAAIPKNDKKCAPHKRRACGKVKYALRTGKLKKKNCLVCSSPKTQAHHEDYDKPLDVAWLCVRHHMDRHIHLRDCETLGTAPKSVKAKAQYSKI